MGLGHQICALLHRQERRMQVRRDYQPEAAVPGRAGERYVAVQAVIVNSRRTWY